MYVSRTKGNRKRHRTLCQEKKKKKTVQLSLDKFVKRTPDTNQ